MSLNRPSFRPTLESLESREVPAGFNFRLLTNVPPAPPASASPAAAGTPAAAAAISVPGGTVLSSASVDAGTRQVVVAEVLVAGAAGNNHRVYATVLDRTSGRPVRSNILLSDTGAFADSRRPVAAVTATGQVVVVWTAVGPGGSNNRIQFRLLNPSAAAPSTGVLQANAPASVAHQVGTAIQIRPTAGGAFTISWIDWTTMSTSAADFAPNGVQTRAEYPAGGLLR
jgi:hypothetical protein